MEPRTTPATHGWLANAPEPVGAENPLQDEMVDVGCKYYGHVLACKQVEAGFN